MEYKKYITMIKWNEIEIVLQGNVLKLHVTERGIKAQKRIFRAILQFQFTSAKLLCKSRSSDLLPIPNASKNTRVLIKRLTFVRTPRGVSVLLKCADFKRRQDKSRKVARAINQPEISVYRASFTTRNRRSGRDISA